MSFLLYLTGILSSYILFFYKIPSSPQLIRTLFENEVGESTAIISVKIIIWFILSLSIYGYIFYRYRQDKTHNKFLIPFKIICLVATFYVVSTPKTKFFNTYFPSKYMHSTYKFFVEKYVTKYSKTNIAEKYSYTDNSSNEVIGILIVGEAARYDHFSLNGYNRNTNPELSKLDNLFSFKANATANYTYLSVPAMLSNCCFKEEDINKETTLLSVLTKLGFHTSWIGTQTLMKYLRNHNTETFYEETSITLIPGGSTLYLPNAHDEVMFPYIFDMLQKEPKQLMVIHTSGSHWNYASRYPETFDRFKPSLTANKATFIDPPSCSKEELINSYDNSILYTDYIISEVIKKVKDKNAFVLYVSDHGESLGENGLYAHGAEHSKEQFEIPFLFWASDRFIADNKNMISRLKQRKKEVLTHQHVFHSILNCFNIKSEIIDPDMSLCSQQKNK